MSRNVPDRENGHDSIDSRTTVREAAKIPAYELQEVDGATLVYKPLTEYREHLGRSVRVGRQLVGVTDLVDRRRLRSELARLGLPVAEAHLLEEFDPDEVRR